jgi:hypothetical protein
VQPTDLIIAAATEDREHTHRDRRPQLGRPRKRIWSISHFGGRSSSATDAELTIASDDIRR